MGTREECLLANEYYSELEKSDDIKSVQISDFYRNRGSNTIFRLYVDVEYISTKITEQRTLQEKNGGKNEKYEAK